MWQNDIIFAPVATNAKLNYFQNNKSNMFFMFFMFFSSSLKNMVTQN